MPKTEVLTFACTRPGRSRRTKRLEKEKEGNYGKEGKDKEAERKEKGLANKTEKKGGPPFPRTLNTGHACFDQRVFPPSLVFFCLQPLRRIYLLSACTKVIVRRIPASRSTIFSPYLVVVGKTGRPAVRGPRAGHGRRGQAP